MRDIIDNWEKYPIWKKFILLTVILAIITVVLEIVVFAIIAILGFFVYGLNDIFASTECSVFQSKYVSLLENMINEQPYTSFRIYGMMWIGAIIIYLSPERDDTSTLNGFWERVMNLIAIILILVVLIGAIILFFYFTFFKNLCL